jgi:hypothetical protein
MIAFSSIETESFGNMSKHLFFITYNPSQTHIYIKLHSYQSKTTERKEKQIKMDNLISIPYTTPPTRAMAKTRFVLISDTHLCTTTTYPILPKGDVLCHARGLSNQGCITELRRTLD